MSEVTLDIYAGLFRRAAMRDLIAEAVEAFPTLRVEVKVSLMRTDWAITGPRPVVEGILRNINRRFGFV